ncbi:MAG: 1,2-phenylacetyl-CoA epoxidase subunit PaaD [Actinomycetota bacterium]
MVSELDTLVRAVDDPELPHVTIGELGMVRSIEVEGRAAHIRLTPTYTGCPATEQIQADVEAAVVAAGYEPAVEFVMSPPWTTDDITDTGRAKLAAAGIAPPSAATDGPVALDLPVECPNCGSRRTRLTAPFGATACKALHHCDACRQPFESFKAI